MITMKPTETRRCCDTCLGLFVMLRIYVFLAVAGAMCQTCAGFETYFSVADVHVTVPKQSDTVVRRLAGLPLFQFDAKSLHVLSYHRILQDTARSNETSDTAMALQPPNPFNYDIYNAYGVMSIDRKSGQISMTGRQIEQLGPNVTVIVEASLANVSNSAPRRIAKMTLTITSDAANRTGGGGNTQSTDYCNDLGRICFWDAVTYKVAENSVEWNQTIGPVGPGIYRHLCPDLIVDYVLLNATTFFTVHAGIIYTNTRIDHDTLAPGPQLTVNVQCRVTRPENAVLRSLNRALGFVVLDRNDNPPILHTTETNIAVQLDSPYVHENSEIGKGIMFSDSDSLSQNSQIAYEILNDYMDLLRPRCQAFEVNQLGLHTSAINCKLFFSRTSHLTNSPYCVIIRASDHTVETADDSASRRKPPSAEATVCLNADLSKLHDIDRGFITPQALKSNSGLESAVSTRKKQRKNRKLIADEQSSASAGSGESAAGGSNADASVQTTAPKKVPLPIYYPHEVHVSRRAAQLYRVVEPLTMRELVLNGGPVFRLSEDGTGGALGITSAAGIVFVKNATALRAAARNIYNITVVFFNKTAQITLHLLAGGAAHSNTSASPNALPASCSIHGTRRECTATAGFGTDLSVGCQWRRNNSTTMTTVYATCSPELTTCPDHMCDPLEELAQQSEHFLCPQDCSAAADIFGPHTVNEERRLGIRSAYGACTCDEFGKCSCGHHNDDERTDAAAAVTSSGRANAKRGKKQQVPTVHTAGVGDALFVTNGSYVRRSNLSLSMADDCGVTCMLLLVLCPIFLVVVILIVIISRARIAAKTKTAKSAAQIANNRHMDHLSDDHKPELSDADVALDASETIALHDFSSNRITMQSTNVNAPTEFCFTSDPDSKWEFPRDQLVLDTVLGEGEFGRVVRGFANDIAGKGTGVTEVAVKMLKTGANSVELLALLSEFQLLQEVKHPNVIRLLGACTLDTPLVIIEYAKHGSLRNYLRLSRKLECSGIEYSDGVEPMQVLDILSFALQICKGMAYLTEIKLVHRDLAARNVLLTEGKVCKISDFGLTRDVYEDDAYLKRSKDRVPVKWMAPESLADHVYTTRSDVWAFGVLAWELITLGASPYPGVPPQNLYHLLKSGYRMERPENCSEEMYRIVRSCWTDDPHVRPPFKWLAAQWELLLGNNAKYLALELNAVSNPEYCAVQADGTATAVTDAEDTTATDEPSASMQQPQPFGAPDKIDHLWRPPRTPTQSVSTPDKSGAGYSMGASVGLALGYDIPRPLIEARTDEQMLRYQNELRTSPLRATSDQQKARNCSVYEVATVDLSHYDRPAVQRRKSYMDMLAVGRSGSVGYNLDRENADKKRLTKDITFRFSSLLNLSERFTSPPM